MTYRVALNPVLRSIDTGGPTPQPRRQHQWGDDIARRLVDEGASEAAAGALAAAADAGHTLGQWAARYMLTKVCGRSKNTLIAKASDLAAFVGWFVPYHAHGDIGAWSPAHTRYFLKALNEAGKGPATRNRVLFTLKYFARYVHEQPGAVFERHGLPTAEVEPMPIDEPECKKLTNEQVRGLFAAAESMVKAFAKKGRAHAAKSRMRPRRNLAILGVLYYTGLRVSEVLALRREQYDGTALHNVVREGGRESRKLVLHCDCVEFIQQCLAKERPLDAGEEKNHQTGKLPLFIAARTGGALDRPRVAAILKRLALAAFERGYVREEFAPHPHQIRHTFGAKYREASGSDTETAAALGHAGIRHVGRYVRKTDFERADL